jgi:hypothetical protein
MEMLCNSVDADDQDDMMNVPDGNLLSRRNA